MNMQPPLNFFLEQGVAGANVQLRRAASSSFRLNPQKRLFLSTEQRASSCTNGSRNCATCSANQPRQSGSQELAPTRDPMQGDRNSAVLRVPTKQNRLGSTQTKDSTPPSTTRLDTVNKLETSNKTKPSATPNPKHIEPMSTTQLRLNKNASKKKKRNSKQHYTSNNTKTLKDTSPHHQQLEIFQRLETRKKHPITLKYSKNLNRTLHSSTTTNPPYRNLNKERNHKLPNHSTTTTTNQQQHPPRLDIINTPHTSTIRNPQQPETVGNPKLQTT